MKARKTLTLALPLLAEAVRDSLQPLQRREVITVMMHAPERIEQLVCLDCSLRNALRTLVQANPPMAVATYLAQDDKQERVSVGRAMHCAVTI